MGCTATVQVPSERLTRPERLKHSVDSLQRPLKACTRRTATRSSWSAPTRSRPASMCACSTARPSARPPRRPRRGSGRSWRRRTMRAAPRRPRGCARACAGYLATASSTGRCLRAPGHQGSLQRAQQSKLCPEAVLLAPRLLRHLQMQLCFCRQQSDPVCLRAARPACIRSCCIHHSKRPTQAQGTCAQGLGRVCTARQALAANMRPGGGRRRRPVRRTCCRTKPAPPAPRMSKTGHLTVPGGNPLSRHLMSHAPQCGAACAGDPTPGGAALLPGHPAARQGQRRPPAAPGRGDRRAAIPAAGGGVQGVAVDPGAAGDGRRRRCAPAPAI